MLDDDDDGCCPVLRLGSEEGPADVLVPEGVLSGSEELVLEPCKEQFNKLLHATDSFIVKNMLLSE